MENEEVVDEALTALSDLPSLRSIFDDLEGKLNDIK